VDSTGLPVWRAVVVLDSLRQTETDARGHFQFEAVPRGSHLLEVRAIGFQPVTVIEQVVSGTAVTALVLAPAPVLLPELAVRAPRPGLARHGFYARAAEGHGRFLEGDSVVRMDPKNLVLALSRQRGFRVRFGGWSGVELGLASVTCPEGFVLWVDGWPLIAEQQELFFKTVDPHDVDGVEIYDNATAPLLFTSCLPRSCVMVLWRR
jgi:hypothetical protein